MIYKFKKSVFILMILLFFSIAFLVPSDSTYEFIQHIALNSIACFLFCGVYGAEYLKRSVELRENSIHFNSYRLRSSVDFYVGRVLNFDLQYSEIVAVDAIILPLFGIIILKLKSNNFFTTVKINWSIRKRKELAYNLCKQLRTKNSKANISPQLKKYLEIKMKEEL